MRSAKQNLHTRRGLHLLAIGILALAVPAALAQKGKDRPQQAGARDTAARPQAQAAREPAPDAVIELWEQHWTLQPDGAVVLHEKQHVRLNNDRVYGEFADPRFTYHTATDKLETLTAHTRLPDGTVVEPTDYARLEVAPFATAGWPAFAGIRQHLIVMPGIEPGCVLELEHKLTRQPGARPYLAADVRLDHRYQVARRVVRITVPRDVTATGRFVNFNIGQAPRETDDPFKLKGDTREWVFNDLPGVPDEPQAAPWQLRCKRLVFSTAGLPSQWLKERTQQIEQAAAAGDTQRIAELAAEWTKDKLDPSDRLRALREKLNATFTVVEFPVEWRPSKLRPAAEVLESCYGLPDEAAAVLLALARAADLPVMPGLLVQDGTWQTDGPQDAMVAAYVVLLNTRTGPGHGEAKEGPAGRQPVDFVDNPEIWDVRHGPITRTARWGGYTLLPVPDVLQPRTLLEPWTKPSDSTCHVQGKVSMAEDGTWTGEFALRLTGLFVAPEALRSADAQKSRIAALVGRVLPDAGVESFVVKTLAPGEFEVSAKAKASKAVKKLDGRHCVQLAQDGPFLADVPLPLAHTHRKTPLHLAGAFEEQIDLTIEWPEKWQVEGTPADVAPVPWGRGTVEQTVELDKKSLKLRRHVRVDEPELEADAAVGLATQVNKLRAERNRSLLLRG